MCTLGDIGVSVYRALRCIDYPKDIFYFIVLHGKKKKHTHTVYHFVFLLYTGLLSIRSLLESGALTRAMETKPEFAALQEQVTTALVQSTRTGAQISSGDLNFQRSCDNNVSEGLDSQNERLIGLVSSLLETATTKSDLKAPNVKAEDGLEDNWRGVVDVVDELLEKSDATLDEYTGIIKRPTASQQERSSDLAKQPPVNKIPSVYDLGPSKIPKPQELFERSPAAGNTEPFMPLLQSKPHAIVPLEQCLTPQQPSGQYVDPTNLGFNILLSANLEFPLLDIPIPMRQRSNSRAIRRRCMHHLHQRTISLSTPLRPLLSTL